MADAAPIRIALVAPDGKMGRAIALATAEDAAFVIDQDDPQVLIDFSAPAALGDSLKRAVAANIPILIGTTGLAADVDSQIAEAAQAVPVLRAANTALGVALLADLVERAAKVLGRGWDIEIAEAHHRFKADAPSGTALMLGEAAAAGRGVSLSSASVRSRDGHTGARRRGDIGFATLRGGDVVGDHTVIFAGAGERIELIHRATDRGIFARGAVKAALWGRGKAPGVYAMRDVLGL